MVTVSGFLLFAFSAFFAVNMGASGFAPSFSAALGARLIGRLPAVLLFSAFVALGALLVGGHVAKTLGDDFVPPGTLDRRAALIIIASASTALFVASLVKVPESTSQVTVFAIMTLGLVRRNLNSHTFTHRILPSWLSVPLIAFVLTLVLSRLLYPLRPWNFRIYEHLSKHEWKLRLLVLGSSCYLATAVGAHVANVVAPLSTSNVIGQRLGMVLFAPLFGVGAALFPSVARTIGNEVAPLGLYSATIINATVATLLIGIYWLGIPQSLVHAHVFATFAIAFAKVGSYEILRHRVIRRILIFWFVTPSIAMMLVLLLHLFLE
jgi:sulfate permease